MILMKRCPAFCRGRTACLTSVCLLLALLVFPLSVFARINAASQMEVPLPSALGEPLTLQAGNGFGSVSDSIGIAVPPGRRGIRPQINLGYSSVGGGGILGAGWGLSFGGRVERWRGDGTPRAASIVSGEASDRYSYVLGGAGGELHDDNEDGVYRAAVENVYRPFRKEGDGWVVYDGQGNLYTFGETPGSRIDGELWLLERLQDKSGNTMSWVYGVECDALPGPGCDGTNRNLYPREIRYTGYAPTSDAGTNLVRFEYEERPDRRLSMRRGVREVQSLRLAGISVWAGDALVRRYRFGYTRYAEGPSRLSEVLMVGADDETEVVLRTAEYSERQLGWPGAIPANLPVDLADAEGVGTGVQLMDVNGDTLADLVDDGESIYLGDGAGSFVFSAAWTAALAAVPSATVDGDGIDTGVRFLDVNSDARPDILVAKLDNSGQPVSAVYLNTGFGWSQDSLRSTSLEDLSSLAIGLADPSGTTACRAPLCTDLGTNPPSGCSPAYCTGDEETDPEDCVVVEEGEEELPVCPGVSEGYSDPVPEPFSIVGKLGEYRGVEMGDINGDGLVDIVWSMQFDQTRFLDEIPRMVRAVFLNGGEDNPGWIQSNALSNALAEVLTNNANGDGSAAAFMVENEYKGYSISDVNGDGFGDIVRSIEGQQAVYLGNGQGWDLDPSYTGSMASNEIFALASDFASSGQIPIDFNDDGLPDYLEAAGSDVRALRNTGEGWVPDTAMEGAIVETGMAFVGAEGKLTGVTLADIDGNGLIDLIEAKEGGTQRIVAGADLRSGLLTRTAGVFGQTMEVDWVASSTFDNVTSSGLHGMPVVLAVASEVRRSDGRGHTYVESLSYEGGLYEATGFRGFATVSSTPGAGLRKETDFYRDEKRNGQPREVRSRDTSGNLRSLSSTETEVVAAELGVEQVLLRTTTTTRYADDGVTVTTQSGVEREYNSFMQATIVRTDPDVEIGGDENAAHYDWLTDESAGFWGFLARVQARGPSDEILSEVVHEHDASGRPIRSKDLVSPGNYLVTELSYDEFGNVVAVTDRNGATTSFGYDATGAFRTNATDPLGRTSASEYDPRFGTLTADVDASGNRTETTYDVFGGKKMVVKPGDEASPHGTVTFALLDLGKPNAQRFEIRYTETVGTSDQFLTVQSFDGLGRIYERRQDGAGGREIVTRVEFDAAGLPARTSLPFFEGDTPEFASVTRDDLGRLVEIEDALGYRISIAHQGLSTETVDGRGGVTRLVSDTAGNTTRIERVLDGTPLVTTYDYTPDGRIAEVVDAQGNATLVEHDLVGRRVRMEDPSVGVFRYDYDGEGRLVGQTGPDGGLTEIVYNAAGDVVEKRYPDGASEVFVYGDATAGNGVGRLVAVFDGAGYLEIFYDQRGRISEKRRSIGDRTYVTGFVYDSMDRIRRMIYPDGFEVHYSYDEGANLLAVTDGDGKPLADEFSYNAGGRIIEMAHGNGFRSSFEYDAMDRMQRNVVSGVRGVSLVDQNYVFDSANNVLGMEELVTGKIQTFDYDDLNRLVRATGPFGEESYEYDSIGNLLRKGEMHFAMDPNHPQRVACAVEIDFNRKRGPEKSIDACASSLPSLDPDRVQRAFAMAYDERGNMTSKGSRKYEYDSQNRLVAAYEERPKRTRFLQRNRYDLQGNLVVQENGRDEVVFIDGIYEESRRRRSTRVTRNIFAGTQLVASVATSGTRIELIDEAHARVHGSYLYAGSSGLGVLLLCGLFLLDSFLGWGFTKGLRAFGTSVRVRPLHFLMALAIGVSPFVETMSAEAAPPKIKETRLYFHANHIGNVELITDGKKTVRVRRSYKPYGEAYRWSSSLHAGSRLVTPSFQGQKFEKKTGLYNFKARHYDAELGRFTTADTVVADISDPRTLHRYAFAGGNPVQFIDPSGRSFWSAVGNFFSSVGDAIVGAANWIADHALEILTVIAIVAVVALATVATFGVAGAVFAAGGIGAAIAAGTASAAGVIGAFAVAGAAIGFATFGGIALSQGNTVASSAFWIAAGTGAVLGGLVGAALPVAFAPTALFGAAGITSVAGSIAAGALIGAAGGGLEAAIACATSCGGVENLFLPILQGVVVGGVLGAIGGGLAGKFLPRNTTFTKRVLRFFVEPGKVGLVVKSTYSGLSSSGAIVGWTGRRTGYGDVIRLGQALVGYQGAQASDVVNEDDDSGGTFYGLVTSPASAY